MALQLIQRDFEVRAGLVVLGSGTVTSSTGMTLTLQLHGGAAIAKNLIVGSTSDLHGAVSIYDDLFVTGATTVSNDLSVLSITSATSTITGALTVVGGAGVGGDIWVGGTIYGNINGTASTSTNLEGGDLGSIPYQTTAGQTSFIPIGTTGTILKSDGSTATWFLPSDLTAGYAVTATNLFGGEQYQIPYQTTSSQTSYKDTFKFNYDTDTLVTVNANFTGTTNAESTTTGALTVVGGVGLGNSLYVGNNLTVVGNSTLTNLYVSGDSLLNVTTASTLRLTATNASTNTTTGALIVDGGVGIAGRLNVGDDSIFENNLTVFGNLYGTISTATNLDSGALGSIPYQTANGITNFIPIGPTDTVLISNGTTATWTSGTSIVAGYSITATNIAGGDQYQIPYQTGAGTTAFESNFKYNYSSNTLITDNIDVTGTTASTSTDSGALVVAGGVGIAGDLNLGGTLSTARDLESENLKVSSTATATTVRVIGTTDSTSTDTGALTVVGGVGVGGNLYVGGDSTIDGTLYATVSGSITTATNIAGGATGSIPYQTALGQTVFIPIGPNNSVLVSNGTTATWNSPSTIIAGNATTASNLAGGAQYQIPYQTANGLTTFEDNFKYNYDTDTLITVNAAITGTTVSTSTDSGALVVAGGLGVVGAANIGGPVTIHDGSFSTSTVEDNSLVVTGGVGISGSLFVDGPTTFNDLVIFSGTATYVYSTNTLYTDNLINLHVPEGSTGTDHTWLANDGKDVGFVFNYYDTADRDGFLGVANDTKWLEWYSDGLEDLDSGTFTGTAYGIFKTGGIRLVHTTASTTVTDGVLTVAGGVGIVGDLNLGGNLNVGSDLSVDGNISGINLNISNFVTATTVRIVSTSESTTTSTGALTVVGGVGIGGNLYVGGDSTIDGTLYATVSGSITTATNIAGGLQGSIPYQTASGQTVFVPIGDNATLLISNGTTATWTTASSISAGYSITATNIAGGAQYQIPYQTSAGATAFESNFKYNYSSNTLISDNASFIGTTESTTTSTGALTVTGGVGVGGNLTLGGDLTVTGHSTISEYLTVGTYLSVNELVTATTLYISSAATATTVRVIGTTDASSTTTGALTVAGGVGIGGNLYVGGDTTIDGTLYATVSGSITTATNLEGGAAGSVPYQSGSGITTFLSIGSTGTILLSNGSNPEWTSSSTVNVGYAANADKILTVTTAENALYYLTLVNSDNSTAAYESVNTRAGLTFRPSNNELQSSGAIIANGALYAGASSNGNILIVGEAPNRLIFNNNSVYHTIKSESTTKSIRIYNDSDIGIELASITGDVKITSTTDSTSTTTGALTVTGGVGIGGNLYVGGTISANGLNYNGGEIAVITAGPYTTTATQTIDSFALASYRSAKYFNQIVSGSNIHVSEISVFHDDTKAYTTEYGISTNNGQLGTFDAIISGTDVVITFTPGSTSATTVKMSRFILTV